MNGTTLLPGTGVVLFSHGSLLCGARSALLAHAERLRGTGAVVAVGFLNYSAPAFEAAAADCVAAGCTRVVVVPYFLVPGKFVVEDLPPHVDAARARWPEVEWVLAECLGEDERLQVAVLESASAARPPVRYRDDLLNAREFCEERKECPLYGVPPCRAAGAVADDSDARPASPEPLLRPEETALVLLAHGSPRAESNAGLERVRDAIAARGLYRSVSLGYLECNEPDIPSSLTAAAQSGAATVVAVPWLLHTGRHVADDVPSLMDGVQTAQRRVQFLLGTYIGASSRVSEVLLSRVVAALG